jgi:gliding motility-associated lipoprotein GldH
MKVKQLLLVLLLALLASSCHQKRVYEDFYSIGRAGWDTDSTARFNVNIAEKYGSFNFLVAYRNLESYPYSNLWLTLRIEAPDKTVVRDTLEIPMAYPNGKWMGKGTGGVYYNEFEYRKNIVFPLPGEYKIAIRHAMRPENLIGIKDIGILIEKP